MLANYRKAMEILAQRSDEAQKEIAACTESGAMEAIIIYRRPLVDREKRIGLLTYRSDE